MKMKLTLILAATFILISSCGFKVLDKSQNSNFSIEEIIFWYDNIYQIRNKE